MDRPGCVAFDWKPSKAWGQNYLINVGVIRKIVDLAGPPPGRVVEIGPGRGALTLEIAARGFDVVAVEPHHETAAYLRETMSGRPAFTLLEEDAATVDFSRFIQASGSNVVVGNLPYCVAARILFQLFRTGRAFDRWVLMFQREVALRIAASHGSRDYGVLSIMAQLSARASMAFHVQPGSFSPAPRVVSTVMVFAPHPDVCLPWDALSAWLTQVFSMRRKQLGKILATLAPQGDPALLARECGFSLQNRPEQLSPETHLRLFDRLFQA